MTLSCHSATSARAIEPAEPRPFREPADTEAAGACTGSLPQRFIHPGAASQPRLLSLQVHAVRELRVTLPCGANVGASLRAALAPFNFSGGMGYICRGSAQALQYHVVEAAAAGDRPYIYGAPLCERGVATMINGTLNLGRDPGGTVLLHCHGGYADSQGLLHGGHVILERTVVGAEPWVLQLCLFGQGGFVQRCDEETHYSLLQPDAGVLQ
jgi:hypothetical protein